MEELARIRVDAAAIKHNYVMAQQWHNGLVCAVVKSNAYGHGLQRVVGTLEALASRFAVATLQEAQQIRAMGISAPIMLLQGIQSKQQLALIDSLHLDLCTHSMYQVEWLTSHTWKRQPVLWIKVDTGMERLGFMPSEFADIAHRLRDFECIAMSHYANADIPESPHNALQIEQFIGLEHVGHSSLGNSAAICGGLACGDIARAGIMVYGYDPTGLQQPYLRATMSFEAPVIAVRRVTVGEYIGYGSRFCVPKNGWLAVLRVGYADGYPRSLPDDTPIYHKGAVYRLAGTVSMDMTTVFLEDNPTEVAVGDWMELWGNNVSVSVVAQCARTIPYALFCGIQSRVQRIQV